jgi:hypothetical protein
MEPSAWLARGVVVVAAAVFTALAVVFLWGAVMSLRDPAPIGPTCWYEVDPGSGPAGVGTERVRWGAFPMKHCVAGDVDHALFPLGALGLLVYPAAGAAGLAVLLAGAALVAIAARRDTPMAQVLAAGGTRVRQGLAGEAAAARAPASGVGGASVAEAERAPPGRRPPVATLVAVVAVAGVALGALSHLGDRTDNIVVLYAFNVGGPWVVAAFAVGAWLGARNATATQAASAAVATLVLADVVYYVAGWRIGTYSTGLALRNTVLWAAASLVVGGPAAAGGWAWARRMPRWGDVGVGLMAGALAGEAIWVVRHVVHDERVLVEVAVALVLAWVLARHGSRALALLTTVAVAATIEVGIQVALGLRHLVVVG